jgi:hypothetical protein
MRLVLYDISFRTMRSLMLGTLLHLLRSCSSTSCCLTFRLGNGINFQCRTRRRCSIARFPSEYNAGRVRAWSAHNFSSRSSGKRQHGITRSFARVVRPNMCHVRTYGNNTAYTCLERDQRLSDFLLEKSRGGITSLVARKIAMFHLNALTFG